MIWLVELFWDLVPLQQVLLTLGTDHLLDDTQRINGKIDPFLLLLIRVIGSLGTDLFCFFQIRSLFYFFGFWVTFSRSLLLLSGCF